MVMVDGAAAPPGDRPCAGRGRELVQPKTASAKGVLVNFTSLFTLHVLHTVLFPFYLFTFSAIVILYLHNTSAV